MGKILESIVAELISYLTETYELLPKQHYGGRPGRTAEDAMLVLEKPICNDCTRKHLELKWPNNLVAFLYHQAISNSKSPCINPLMRAG